MTLNVYLNHGDYLIFSRISNLECLCRWGIRGKFLIQWAFLVQLDHFSLLTYSSEYPWVLHMWIQPTVIWKYSGKKIAFILNIYFSCHYSIPNTSYLRSTYIALCNTTNQMKKVYGRMCIGYMQTMWFCMRTWHLQYEDFLIWGWRVLELVHCGYQETVA